MRSVHRHGLFMLSMAGFAMVLAPGVAGQEAGNGPAKSDPELDQLHDEAMAVAYSSAKGDLERATWMHGFVAYRRQHDDVRRFECLRIQADLLHAIGYLEGARLYLEEAARHAEATSDPYDAAMTYIDAALLAQEAGDRWATMDLGYRARALVSSPGLDINHRASILDRVEPGWRR